MKKIVIIGANDFQNQLILKAKDMGYETHVFAWEDGAVGKDTADYFYPVSIVEKEEILNKCREIQPDGVCSIASDLAVLTVNFVAEALGLNCNPCALNPACTNKYEMRKAFSAAGVAVPKFRRVSAPPCPDELEGMTYPMIVKPTDRSGSRSITKVFRFEEIAPAVENAVGSSFEKACIIEEYIDGDEYSCECISYNGKHYFLALTKKHTTGSPSFIETGHVQPSDIPAECQEDIKTDIFKALDALGIRNGASHSEFKLGKDGHARIIEIGARMGGDCIGSDLVRLSTGYDFMRMVIDIACGDAPDFTPVNKAKSAEIRFIFSEDDLKELDRIKAENPDSVFRISDIEPIVPGAVKDSSTRFGYYIITE